MATPWRVPGFTEVAELGRGGGGSVVRAVHDDSGTDVAIKYLGDDLLGDPAFREAFRAEAQLLADLGSPHVVGLLEYVESERGAAIVMELVEGASLRRTLAEHGPTAPESALTVLKGSLLGLAAAHAVDVVHRDYKPENVLVGMDGRSRLVDFGVAGRSGISGDGSGTPAYMAPEQWAGAADSPRGDIYAATATFVECVTGVPPYAAPDLDTLRDLHEHAPVPDTEVPEPLRGLVHAGLAKEPDLRPANADAFLVELERVAAAGYGEDWEDRGHDAMARRIALLALLLPGAAGAAAGSAVVSSVLGSGVSVGSRGIRAAVLAGAAAIVVGGIVLATTGPQQLRTESFGGAPVAPAPQQGSVQFGPAQPGPAQPNPAQPAPAQPAPAQPSPALPGGVGNGALVLPGPAAPEAPEPAGDDGDDGAPAAPPVAPPSDDDGIDTPATPPTDTDGGGDTDTPPVVNPPVDDSDGGGGTDTPPVDDPDDGGGTDTPPVDDPDDGGDTDTPPVDDPDDGGDTDTPPVDDPDDTDSDDGDSDSGGLFPLTVDAHVGADDDGPQVHVGLHTGGDSDDGGDNDNDNDGGDGGGDGGDSGGGLLDLHLSVG